MQQPGNTTAINAFWVPPTPPGPSKASASSSKAMPSRASSVAPASFSCARERNTARAATAAPGASDRLTSWRILQDGWAVKQPSYGGRSSGQLEHSSSPEALTPLSDDLSRARWSKQHTPTSESDVPYAVPTAANAINVESPFPVTKAPPPSPSASVGVKRPRSPPFEWSAEPEPEQAALGFLSLKGARTVNVEIKPRGQDDKAAVLPLPLPSKRAKKTGGRAVLVPVEQLPVFPLPPLPPINDDELVFTHSSLFERERGLFEYPDAKPARHYEKLEHVGDSILGMVVTTWLQEMKPGLTCGTATKLKAHLVSNATLSHISGMYNFPQRLNGDARLLPLLRAQTDVRAAIVEAYIAALYLAFPVETRATDGLAVVTAWLREMYEPLYDFCLKYMRAEHEQHYSAMGAGVDGILEVAASPEDLDRMDQRAQGMALLVNMWAKCRDRHVEWDCERYETSVGALWRMRLSVDGIEMADATRATARRAKDVAAFEAAKKLGLAEE